MYDIVGTPSPPHFLQGAGVEPPTKFSKSGALVGPHLLEGGLQFSHKNKLKSEIFNDKKVYKQKYFSLS